MPHANEFAQHKILGRFTENPEVKKLLEECKEPEYQEDRQIPIQNVSRRNWRPRYVVAIDGSHHEVAYDKGFPGAELSYISVANVLINVDKLISESNKPTINPVEFNKVQSAYTLTTVMPSTNMVRVDFQ